MTEGGTTPRTTPVVVVPAPRDPIGTQQEEPNEDDDLDDDIHADQIINTSFGDGDFMPRVEEAYQHDEDARDLGDPGRNPLAPRVSSLLLKRCLQQLAPSPSLKQMPPRDLFSARPHSVRWPLRR